MKIKNGVYIIGTDTGVGKTYFAANLLQVLVKNNFTTIAIKPIASGCQNTSNGLRNSDALILQKHSTLKLPYSQINPFAFQPAIAPHIAAAHAGMPLTVNKVIAASKAALKEKVDWIVIEGVGGLLVPLNEEETQLDLIKAYNYPVILVVAIKLGCLNHAVLTAEHLKNQKIKLAGWVANVIDQKTKYIHENIRYLQNAIKAPYLTM